MKYEYESGSIKINDSIIPRISTKLVLKDYLGTFMIRWGINRTNYMVRPGLYAIGTPDHSSDVFVTANYKLSFDTLRKNLECINGWVLILDTKGINVWCAAGKGTFGTKELIKKIGEVSLDNVITHKRIIIPQLGATGIAAHKVKEATGFNIHYGPVKAADINKYISAGYHKTSEMRKVTFNFIDRIKLISNDFVYGRYYLLSAIAIILLISALSNQGVSFGNIRENGLNSVIIIIVAYFFRDRFYPDVTPMDSRQKVCVKGIFHGDIDCNNHVSFRIPGR